jgi:predicted metal-binding membrane protein
MATRDRLIVGAALLSVALLAWAYLLYDAHAMTTGESCCSLTEIGGRGLSPITAIPPLFLMWSIMMIAMMLPTALPMVLTFAALSRNRRRAGRRYVPVAIFVAGYLIVWCGFSAIAAIGQWFLHRSALLSSSMTSTSALLAGLLLLAAGLFQFTPLKHACLKHCRSTFEFIMTRWREGSGGALRMGMEHGAFCTGCCWALMCLLFVVGVMNLFWVGGLTILICVEKMLPARARITFATGMVLIACGAGVLLHYSQLTALF